MRICEYLGLAQKMKEARKQAKISQRDMARSLDLKPSAYSNYENGYSEPPVETVLKFCEIIGIRLEDLIGMEVPTDKRYVVRTFSDFLYILINMDRRGIPITGNTTYEYRENTSGMKELVAHLDLEILNAQIATFIPDWNNKNEDLKKGLIDESEYEEWINDTLKMFDVPIEQFSRYKDTKRD